MAQFALRLGRPVRGETMTTSGISACSPIASAVLPGGDHLELIRSDKNSTRLLRWSGGRASTGEEFQVGRRRFTPAKIGQTLPRQIGLATGVSDYKSAANLFNSIADVFQSMRGLEQNNAEMATCFVFVTYFADCRDPAPRAIVTATDTWDALQVLSLFGSLCRHPVAGALLKAAGDRNLAAGCCPTLVLSDSSRFGAHLQFLEATQFHGFGMAQSGCIENRPFSAVMLESDPELDDAVPDTFCRINATPQIRPQLLDAEALRSIAETFQPQLLQYRLKNRPRVAGITFDPGSLSGATRALGSTLGSCFPDCDKLQNRVVKLLEPQDQERRLDHARSERAVVIEALLIACHEGRESAHVGEIAELGNGILDLRGDGYRLEARKVGSILRSFSLGLRRDSRGYGFLLSTECRRRVHQLGRVLDVAFFQGKIEKCDICKSLSPDAL
jgi:hypothetical protein